MGFSSHFSEDEAAVTSVIGIILLVAMTVILSAVAGVVVFDVPGSVMDPAPTASFEFDYDDDTGDILVTHTNGDTIHGENLRTGTNTRENDLLNIINRLGYQKNKTYVLQGHLHHLEKQGQGYRHILLPSIVGADDLSANIMNTSSRPGQMAFMLNDEGIEIEKYTYFD